MANIKRKTAFYNGTSWCIRIRKYNKAERVIYTVKSGYKTKKEAENALEVLEDEFKRQTANKGKQLNPDMKYTEYLIYWYEEIFRVSDDVENSTKMCADYTIYDLILKNVKTDIEVKYLNADYLEEILEAIAKESIHEANTARYLMRSALDFGVKHHYIATNVALETKAYKRPEPTIHILNKVQIRAFLLIASMSEWYFEILLALFLGLRKGEILGLRLSDFNIANRTVHIQRQITSNPVRVEVNKGEGIKGRYRCEVGVKKPKRNSKRTLKCPDIIMQELEKRVAKIESMKREMGDDYVDNDYLSCQPNGMPHNVSSLNNEITKICKTANLPHVTVHGLRHMFASILLEQNVSLRKVSAMLGHKSVMTTFEYYADVIEGDKQIVKIINDAFPGGDSNETA